MSAKNISPKQIIFFLELVGVTTGHKREIKPDGFDSNPAQQLTGCLRIAGVVFFIEKEDM